MSVPLRFRPVLTQVVIYECTRGHLYKITFAGDVQPPAIWECRCGKPSAGDAPAEPELQRRMTQLLERRTRAQLEALLAERLGEIRRVGGR